MKKNIVLVLVLFGISTMQGTAQKADDKSLSRIESSLEVLIYQQVHHLNLSI